MHARKPPATAEKVLGPSGPRMPWLLFLLRSQQAAHIIADAVSCRVCTYAVVDKTLELVVRSSRDRNKAGMHEISIHLRWRPIGDARQRNLAHDVWHKRVCFRKYTEA